MKASQCPLCSKPSAENVAPFCSDHCRKLDLNRWFTGAYAVPAVELDDVDESEIEQLSEGQDDGSS